MLSFEAMEGAVSRGIERGSADGLEGVVKMQEMYGIPRVLQIANKVCIMEGPCSRAHPLLLQFLPLHGFDCHESMMICSWGQ
jgi:hypothetical protein